MLATFCVLLVLLPPFFFIAILFIPNRPTLQVIQLTPLQRRPSTLIHVDWAPSHPDLPSDQLPALHTFERSPRRAPAVLSPTNLPDFFTNPQCLRVCFSPTPTAHDLPPPASRQLKQPLRAFLCLPELQQFLSFFSVRPGNSRESIPRHRPANVRFKTTLGFSHQTVNVLPHLPSLMTKPRSQRYINPLRKAVCKPALLPQYAPVALLPASVIPSLPEGHHAFCFSFFPPGLLRYAP